MTQLGSQMFPLYHLSVIGGYKLHMCIVIRSYNLRETSSCIKGVFGLI